MKICQYILLSVFNFFAFTFLVSAGLVDLKQRRDRLFLIGHFEKFLNYDYHMYL